MYVFEAGTLLMHQKVKSTHEKHGKELRLQGEQNERDCKSAGDGITCT